MAAGEVIRDKMVRKLSEAKSVRSTGTPRRELQAQKVQLFRKCVCTHSAVQHRTVERGSCMACECKEFRNVRS